MTQLELNIKALNDRGIRVKDLSRSFKSEAEISVVGTSICPLQLKDFDNNKGIVAFYFAGFGNKDSDNDIIMPGAYTKTIKENIKRIKHFYNHDLRDSPGKILELGQDEKGAYSISQLARTTTGRDRLIEYEAGIITEHSQGFQVVQESYDEFQGANVIKEIKLWEVSSLTAWGANENTPVIGVKDVTRALDLMKNVNYILNHTGITDDRAEELLIQYNLIKEKVSEFEKKKQEDEKKLMQLKTNTDLSNILLKIKI